MKLGSCGDPAGARLGVEKGVTGVGAAAEGFPEEKNGKFMYKEDISQRNHVVSFRKNIEIFSKMV